MLDDASLKLKACADPTRLKILLMLGIVREVCVCQLIEALKMPQTTVSKALMVLKRANLVSDRRDGQWVRYSLSKNRDGFPMSELLKWAKSATEVKALLCEMKRVSKIPLEKICCNKPWRN